MLFRIIAIIVTFLSAAFFFMSTQSVLGMNHNTADHSCPISAVMRGECVDMTDDATAMTHHISLLKSYTISMLQAFSGAAAIVFAVLVLCSFAIVLKQREKILLKQYVRRCWPRIHQRAVHRWRRWLALITTVDTPVLAGAYQRISVV